MRIAIETGTHSPWVSRLLEECGHEVLVANSRKLRLIYSKTGSRAGRSTSGMCSLALLWKLLAGHLGRR